MGASDDDILRAVRVGVTDAVVPLITPDLISTAVRQGVENALYRALNEDTSTPGADLRDAIREGVADGILRLYPEGIPLDEDE